MTMTVRLSARTERAVNALARRRRQTRSDVVRDALEQDEKARNVSEQIATKSYKLAEAALAILSLTIHDDGRVWKWSIGI